MADLIYEVDGGDGQIYEVRAPEGTSNEDLFSFVRLQQYEAGGKRPSREAEEEEPERTAPVRQEDDLFSTNVGRGVDLIQQMYGSALEGAGSVTGLEGLERYGTDIVEANRRELEASAGAARSTEDIDSAGGLVDYVLATFGAQVPQLGSTLAGSYAGAKAGAALGSIVPGAGTAIGGVLGGIAGGLAANLPFFYGSNREAQKAEIEAGNITEISESAAALTALPQSALDFISDRLLVGGFTGKAAMGGGIFTRGAKGAGAGIVTEVPTEIGQQVLERLQAGQDIASDEALDEYFEVAVAAGLVGGTVRGAGEIYSGRKRFEDDPTEPTQDDPAQDIFPALRDVDLGTAPTEDTVQGELFPDAELGTAPERADDRQDDGQLDLFVDARASELRQRVLDLEAERQRIIDSPIVPFEVEGDQFVERIDNEIDQARAELATIEGRATAPVVRPEPTQLDFGAELDRQQTEQQQAAAREREAIAAIERGDEAAYAQPDLFPQEATAARTVEQETAALRRMGRQEVTPETAPEVAPDTAQQLDIEDAIADRTRSDEETAQLEEMIAAEQKERDESARESIEAQLAAETTTDLEVTTSERQRVLDSVLTDIGTGEQGKNRKYTGPLNLIRNNLTKQFSQALKNEGITNTAPTAAERRAINRAADVEKAVQDDQKPTLPTRKELRAQKDAERKAAAQAEPTLTASPISDVATTPTSEQVTEEQVQGAQDVGQQLDFFGESFDTSKADNVPARKSDAAPVPAATPAVGGDTIGTAAPTTAGMDDTADSIRGAARRAGKQLGTLKKGVTEEGADFIADAKKGMPGSITSNLRRIAEENDIQVDKQTTPQDIVKALEEKQKEAEPKTKPKTKAKPKPRAGFKLKEKTGKGLRARPIVKKGEARKDAPSKIVETEFTGPKRTEAEIAKMEKESPYGYMAEVNKEKLRTGRYNREEEVTADKDPFTAQDRETIAELIEEGTTARDKNGISAIKYLGNFANPLEGMAAAIYDVAYNTPTWTGREKGLTKAQNEKLGETYRGTGAESADRALAWAEENLSPQTKKWIEKEEIRVAKQRAEELQLEVEKKSALESINLMNDKRVQQQRELYEQIEIEVEEGKQEDARTLNKLNNDHQKRLLELDAVVGLDLPPHPGVVSALKEGNLSEALGVLAGTSPSGRVKQIATRLVQRLGDTKVEVVKNLTDAAGTRVAGMFDPKTNTIKVDAETGLNIHTILHETTHALTSATLANKSHPVTKQLEKLFNQLKEQGLLDSFYGSQNLDEFVAEAFSNPKFQTELAGMNPSGSQVSALHRFFNTIGNFVRRMLGMNTKPVGSALNQADQFIEAMLAPAPEFRASNALFLNLDKLGEKLNNMQDAVNARFTKEDRQKTADKFRDTFNRKVTSEKVKRLLAFFAPMQFLTEDVAPLFGFKSAGKLYKAIDTMQGDINDAETRVDGTIKKLEALLKGVDKEAFNRLVYGSTREQVHPYEAAPKKGTPERAVYDAMEKDKKTIGDKGRKAFEFLEKAYLDQFNELKTVLSERIDNLDMPDAEKEKLQTSVFDKLFDKGRLKPYFPLTRKGDLWLAFEAKDENGQPEQVRMAFETQTALDRFKAQLLEENPKNELDSDGYGPGGVKIKTINEYKNASKLIDSFSKAPASQFVGQVLKTLQQNNVDSEVQNEFMELFLNALPESSFAKSLSRRSNEGAGVVGFIQDSEDAFRQKAYNMAAQIQRLKGSNSIDFITAKLEEEFNTIKEDPEQDSTNARIIYDELVKRADFAKNPPKNALNKMAVVVNRFAFMATLGLNVSSAVVNLSQVPLMMTPLLGAKYGYRETFQALRDASLVFTGSGGTRKVGTIGSKETDVEVKAAWSMDNWFDTMDDGTLVIRPEKLKGLDPKNKEDKAKIDRLNSLKTLVEVAGARGQLNRSMFYDTLAVEMSGRDKTLMDYASVVSAFIFHHAERYNRQIALTATYNLELDRLNSDKATKQEKAMSAKDKEIAAANEAVLRAQEMNGGAFLATAPRVAQQGLGRMGMMYKTFGVQMYATMFKIARQSFLVDLPKNLKEQGISDGIAKTMSQTAFRQLKGIMGSSLLLAGLQGMPIYGAVSVIADLFRDEDEEDFDTATRQVFGETIYKGGVNALFGIDVANRIGLSNLLFRMNPYNKDRSLPEYAAELFGGPGLSVATQMFRGAGDIMDGKGVLKGIQTMSPSAIRNVMRSAEYFTEGKATTRRGDVIADDITTGEALSQFFGFAPTKVTFQQERNMSTKNIDRATGERRSNLLKKLYIAFNEGDSAGFGDVLKEISKFNKRHYYHAIDQDTINRSLTKSYETTLNMHNGITISPKLRATLSNHRDDYWGRNEWNLVNPANF